MDSIQDIVRSRLQAALNGWKLYPAIGAGLDVEVGGVRSYSIQGPLGGILNWHEDKAGRSKRDQS